jgi:hypothetical protein
MARRRTDRETFMGLESPKLPENSSKAAYHLIASLVIAVLVVIIYSNTLDASFHLDDFVHIEGNQLLKRQGSVLSLLMSPERGISKASFALNYAYGGTDVTGYHVVNISIHIINSILVYFVLFFLFLRIKSLSSRAKRLAFFSALIFAAHPIQTQAVTYITQRHEILSALFSLTALLFFLLALRAGSRAKRIILYALVPLSYFLAFNSKEIAITLPIIIFLCDYFFTSFRGNRGLRTRWALHAVMAVLLIFFMGKSLANMSVFVNLMEERADISAPVKRAESGEAKPEAQVDERAKSKPSAGFAIEGLSPAQYLLTEFNVLTYYIGLLALPVNQNIDYDFPISNSLFETPQTSEGTRLNFAIPAPIVSLVIIFIILSLSLFLLWRSVFLERQEARIEGRGLIASFFILWFFITLSPTSSILPIIDVIFEHRLYLASLGFFVIVALIVDWLSCLLSQRLKPRVDYSN